MNETRKSYESRSNKRPGDRIFHVERRQRRRRLRIIPNVPGFFRFFWEVVTETPFLPLIIVLIGLWLLSALGIYLTERMINEQFHSYGYTLWWAFTAMQTQGANIPGPITSVGMLIGAIWSIVGTIAFFGVIIATIYAYYMAPRRRPSRVIVEALQYNLDELEYLNADELAALRDTVTNIVNARISTIAKSV